MVNFGKKLTAEKVEEWNEYYIDYKLMKKKVKQYSQQNPTDEKDRKEVLKEFSKLLDNEIEKVVLFILEQQGRLASNIQKLELRRNTISQISDSLQITELRDSYRAIGFDLLKLLCFVDLNATGIRKILKKIDKRLKYKFMNYYVSTRSNHPYSQLQQVFRQVGLGAVVGALTRNLAFLQDNEGSELSIYDHPFITLKDPVIEQINVSVDKLTHSTNILQYLAQRSLIDPDEISTNNTIPSDQSYHFPSLILNLVNTFLYMINTYIIVPTADDYSVSLGAAATVCGVIIGSMAVAQVFSSVYFSAWSNKSYFRPLVFSSVMLFFGNLMYALAFDFGSLPVLLVGRLMCGLGSARAVNRRYISDCVPLKTRLQASAGFVSASALGMACGPGLAGLLQVKFKIFKLTFNQNTMPGWIMALAWLVYLVWLCASFQEPAREDDKDDNSQFNCSESRGANLEEGLNVPLLKEIRDEVIEDCDKNEERGPVKSIGSAYRLLTPSIKAQLLIYFMLKFAMEILLSASSVVTSYYFDWSTSNVAIFLAILGFTVLPINTFIGSYVTRLFEDRQILLVSEILVLIGIILSFKYTSYYSVPQYVMSALITFVASQVLEGVNLSLLSRVMSSRLARGTFNGGLLSTEAGTLARVVADGTITLAGYLGQNMLLNVTLVPSLLICVGSIVATLCTFNSLY